MIPVGYMYKRIVNRPDGLNCQNVSGIYSVSGCISSNFADYIPYWKHNKYWFFNKPEDMDSILRELEVPNTFELLFYEMYEKEFDEDEQSWQEIHAEESFGYDVKNPSQKEFLGFDIVNYSVGTSPEHSPLSCNLLCQEVNVNQYCLLDAWDYAKQLTESLNDTRAEPGPYRMIAVNKVNTTP